jgi:transcriptional regulator with XRE-family HTH domain
MSSIGNRLKTCRLGRGLNQKGVADVAGVTNAAVSKWESNGGESMSALVAMQLADHLNVNPYWLILGQGKPTDEVKVPEISAEALDLARRIDRLPDDVLNAVRTLLSAVQR